MGLEPYNPSAYCRKCGGDDIRTRFCGTGNRCGLYDCRAPWKHQDVMHRFCRRCNHKWDELPLDAVQETGHD